MRTQKTAYELRESQVSTPPDVVSLFWTIVRRRRNKRLSRVLDLGAGDGRFAVGGHFRRYDGVEIDRVPVIAADIPATAKIHRACAFRFKPSGYDACIGNPPYVRHHDFEGEWREKIAKTIKNDLGIDLSGIGNLYLYFLCLALMKTHKNGLVGVVVPFEWVSRPSAKPIRDFIVKKKWDVEIFRFQEAIFDGVLTTACVVIIDKRGTKSAWKYHDISPSLDIKPRSGISGNNLNILPHSKRHNIWARRGISPGGQVTFTLTEAERKNYGLHLSDVLPCVTSLRPLPASVKYLTKNAFQRYFVDAGEKCWLIKSAEENKSQRLIGYLNSVPKTARQTYACQNQTPWYRYEQVPIPEVLFHSGFMKRGPKVLVNTVRAQAVGSVYGIHSNGDFSVQTLRGYLSKYNFERRIVAHAHTLRKVEVAQLNYVLSAWGKKAMRNGRKATR